jgi:hypothetical protein
MLVPIMQYRLRAVTLVGQSTEDCELQVSSIKIGGNLSFQTLKVRQNFSPCSCAWVRIFPRGQQAGATGEEAAEGEGNARAAQWAARVGRSIALSSSQTCRHINTRGLLIQAEVSKTHLVSSGLQRSRHTSMCHNRLLFFLQRGNSCLGALSFSVLTVIH